MDFLRSFVYSIHNVSESSFKAFKDLTKDKSFKKGDTIVSLGQIPKNFYIIKSGIARAFITDEKGKEHTRTLYTPVSTTGNLSSLITKQPSELVYECLTNCETVECNYDAFYELSYKHHDLSIFQHKVLEKIYIREESRILDLALLSATERYQKLLNNYPKIGHQINQYHIASYLNITAVQLSRIKKDLLQ